MKIRLGVLIIFAVIASFAVLREGLQDPSRNKFRLALHCIMILTSVVPPELPMELSLSGAEFGECGSPLLLSYVGFYSLRVVGFYSFWGMGAWVSFEYAYGNFVISLTSQ